MYLCLRKKDNLLSKLNINYDTGFILSQHEQDNFPVSKKRMVC